MMRVLGMCLGHATRCRRGASGALLGFALVVAAALALCCIAAPTAWADEAPSSSSAASANEDAASNAGEADADSGKANDEKQAQSAASKKSGEEAVVIDGESNTVDPTQRADNSFIYDTTVESLFGQASLYEGKVVQVTGEAIGDIVAENPLGGKYCWVTLTSTDAGNSATISVLLSHDQAGQIDHLGRYGVVGTTLQVRGIYHQACSEHEGIPDIHATASSVLVRGAEHPDKFELEGFVPGLITVLIGLVLMGAYYIVRERAR